MVKPECLWENHYGKGSTISTVERTSHENAAFDSNVDYTLQKNR